jgi:hypothetical protein
MASYKEAISPYFSEGKASYREAIKMSLYQSECRNSYKEAIRFPEGAGVLFS